MNESTSVIDSVQMLSLGESEISPLLTKVKIKVFHLGANRNQSYISKETAMEMAKTLRGCPIVGFFREEKGDFTDHGQEITINDKGMNITVLTKPYGFVDLNADVWFEDYIDIDEFGNQLQHTYLVTEGVVWSEQYPELKETLGLDGARPQSMELDEKTLKGTWAGAENSNMEFFIINDATITKLCMLGEDVEPCFLGASVEQENNVSSHFSKNDNFNKTLIKMMQEFKTFALQGGNDMENEMVVEETPVVTEEAEIVAEPVETEEAISAVEESPIVEEATPSAEFETEAEAAVGEAEEPVVETVDAVPAEAEFVKKEDDEEGQQDTQGSETEEAKSDEDEEAPAEKDDEDKKKYALLEQKYNELETKFAAMTEEYQALVEFKNSVENEKKDELINSFYMLDEADKADVIANKAQYSYEDIESKLSVVFARKQMAAMAAEADTESIEKEAVATTYTLVDDMAGLPDWVKAVRETENTMN